MRRPKTFIAVLGVTLISVLGSYAPLRAQEQIASKVDGLNQSGIAGTLSLMAEGSGRSRIEVRVNGSGAGPLPIHIHDGTCADMNPVPKIPLTNVVAGTSTTELDVSVSQLVAVPHSIYLHKSAEELAVFVACANIESPAAQGATIPATGEASGLLALAPWLVGLGAAMAAVGLTLRRAVRRKHA